MSFGTHETADRPSADDRPYYTFEIDPYAIHAGILRAHEERNRAVMAMLRGAAAGVVRAASWIARQAADALHGHGDGRHPGPPGALAR